MIFYFFKQQILFYNRIPAQDEQRPMKLRIQTTGTVQRRNTLKNTHEDNTHQMGYMLVTDSSFVGSGQKALFEYKTL